MAVMQETAPDVFGDEKITDLLVRYWGIGRKPLNAEEKEVLLVALDEENKSLGGPIHRRALARLREKGIT
jgi:hypothetical protein